MTMHSYREGFTSDRPFLYSEYLGPVLVERALYNSLEWVIAHNLASLVQEYADSPGNFADYGYKQNQLDIIKNSPIGTLNNILLRKHTHIKASGSPDIYKEARKLTDLNPTAKIATTLYPIKKMNIPSDKLQVTLDISPKQRDSDLNPIPLPHTTTLVTPVKLAWKARQKELEGTLIEQATHQIYGSFKKFLYVAYLASYDLLLSQDSQILLNNTIRQAIIHTKYEKWSITGKENHSGKKGNPDGTTPDDF